MKIKKIVILETHDDTKNVIFKQSSLTFNQKNFINEKISKKANGTAKLKQELIIDFDKSFNKLPPLSDNFKKLNKAYFTFVF